MITPKEALEEIAFCWGHLEGCNTKVDTSGECDCFVKVAKAAIPVAELEYQAVELLKQHKLVMTAYSSANYEDWAIARDALLAQIAALK